MAEYNPCEFLCIFYYFLAILPLELPRVRPILLEPWTWRGTTSVGVLRASRVLWPIALAIVVVVSLTRGLLILLVLLILLMLLGVRRVVWPVSTLHGVRRVSSAASALGVLHG